uniref:Uncharacterized protein n=1 Tax=Anguilla anguilla TaxID=7936 RepID=A0A0E9UV03_ANGAN
MFTYVIFIISYYFICHMFTCVVIRCQKKLTSISSFKKINPLFLIITPIEEKNNKISI